MSDRNHKYHIQLWDWLAVTGSKYKEHWPVWQFLEDEPFFEGALVNHCFACNGKVNEDCINGCPIDWGGFCDDYGTLYDQWDDCADKEERRKLSAQIRDLPWKSKEEGKG